MATLVEYLQHILAQKDPLLSNETKRMILKEALQAYVLDSLYNHPVYRCLNFYGGTCLHIVYVLNRLSEDINLDNGNEVSLADLSIHLTNYFEHTFGYHGVTAKTQEGELGILRTTLKFPILNALRLSAHANEALHLKVEVSQNKQIAVIRRTPVLAYGRSFVPAHFSLETMMAGKMLACLERNFHRGREGAVIKGRDFYDLLWFMQQGVQPYARKLAGEGAEAHTISSAVRKIKDKVASIRQADLAVDLLPLFEQRAFITSWLEAFHEQFELLANRYIQD